MTDSESDVTRHHKKCHRLRIRTMQKLFQPHAYNQGSAPPSSDVRAESQKEPQPVVQLPTLDWTPQNDRGAFASASLFSQSSPTKVPLHSVPEEPFPLATTGTPPPPPKPSRQMSLRIRPTKMLMSDMKSQRQASKVDLTEEKPISGNGNFTRAKSAWDANDSFLPRAKPPPPLILVPKERKSSKNTKNFRCPSDPSLSSRPSTSPHESTQPLSKSRSVGSRPIQRMIGVPILKMPIEPPCDDIVDVEQPPLTRSNTRTTISSEATVSTLTLDILPPEPKCAWNWTPPADWSGPPEATAGDEDNEPKHGGGFGFIGRKRAKSVARSGVRERLKTARSFERMGSIYSVDVSEPEEDVAVVQAQKVSVARAEVVEIQCYKGWDEKPVADVIHKLRELKSK